MSSIVVKLGSSTVVDSDGNLRASIINHVCQQIAELEAAGHNCLLVTSGAIAIGVQELGLKERPVEMAGLQAASAVGQGKVYRAYDQALQSSGLRSAQVLLTFSDLHTRANYLNARRTLNQLAKWQTVPIVNENDTTTTDEISFGDNDFLAAQVAVMMSADLLLLLTEVDGLYTDDPRKSSDAKLVEQVEDLSVLQQYSITQSTSALGSGGMQSKVLAAQIASSAQVKTVICNGTKQNVIAEAVSANGRVGTTFAARDSRESSFKLWLRYAKPVKGGIAIDNGAEKALKGSGGSLLPVGIKTVSGTFEAGDAVEIRTLEGALIGKGVSNFPSDQLDQIKGLKSEDVVNLVGSSSVEAIHRDNLVLEE